MKKQDTETCERLNAFYYLKKRQSMRTSVSVPTVAAGSYMNCFENILLVCKYVLPYDTFIQFACLYVEQKL